MSRPIPGQATPIAPGRADQWIRRTATVTVVGLAGIAGTLSYSHMRQLAEAHGQAGWHAHTLPLSVDGVEIVASLVLLADRRASRQSGWLPWAALIIGTAASLAANVATAQPTAISRLITGWPALALLISPSSSCPACSSTATPPTAPPFRSRRTSPAGTVPARTIPAART
jgi:hypothetical protein